LNPVKERWFFQAKGRKTEYTPRECAPRRVTLGQSLRSDVNIAETKQVSAGFWN
jgi:hypothetical protein